MKRAFSTLLATVLASITEQAIALKHIFGRGRPQAVAGAFGKFPGSRRARKSLDRIAMLLPAPWCRKKL